MSLGASAQNTYDTLLNTSLMESSRCSGRGGNWSGMTCSGGSGGSGGFTDADLVALQEAIGTWHKSEMRKATCLMKVSAKRTLEELGEVLRQHIATFQPPEIHIFQESPQSFLLTHGYTRMLIGHSLSQRVRRGEIPRTASCSNIDYAERRYKVIASGVQRGTAGQISGFEWAGDANVVAALLGR